MDYSKKPQKKNPRKGASSLSQLLFLWVLPLMFKGCCHGLGQTDLTKSLKQDRSEDLGDKLETWVIAFFFVFYCIFSCIFLVFFVESFHGIKREENKFFLIKIHKSFCHLNVTKSFKCAILLFAHELDLNFFSIFFFRFFCFLK